ncbi:hypothetical protein Q5P01_018410 [Channa striata]|uniref:Uncharacterized protein n=1 Tax=Channa striata TaxID=64152 RepID=A0AA88M4Y1_CHASR|nr:hypothetical protein Q5P01_018410 [Channa striata]
MVWSSVKPKRQELGGLAKHFDHSHVRDRETEKSRHRELVLRSGTHGVRQEISASQSAKPHSFVNTCIKTMLTTNSCSWDGVSSHPQTPVQTDWDVSAHKQQ